MDVSTVAKDLKMVALLPRTVPKTRKPNQRHDDGPTIHEIDRESLVVQTHQLGSGLLYFNR